MFDIDSMPEFRSGNSVPVTRATISRERMREVMEAYADARVREALQVVAGTVEQYHPKATPKGIAAAIKLIAITDGLIAPPLPGPVEPTT